MKKLLLLQFMFFVSTLLYASPNNPYEEWDHAGKSNGFVFQCRKPSSPSCGKEVKIEVAHIRYVRILKMSLEKKMFSLILTI